MDQYIKDALDVWIRSRFKQTKGFNKNHTSYGLKHMFAYELGQSTGKGQSCFYVTNDEFKAAMIENGYIPNGLEELNPMYRIYIIKERRRKS